MLLFITLNKYVFPAGKITSIHSNTKKSKENGKS